MSAFLAAVLVIASLPFDQPSIGQVRIERDFNEPINSISVENPDGMTEAQTWNGSFVRVIASRTGDGQPVLDTEVAFDKRSQGALKITAKPVSQDKPINLVLYVPSSVNLSIKSVKGRATIKGSPLGLSVETYSGDITFDSSGDAHADISARSVNGAVRSTVAIESFTPSDSHSLDGRIGRGGSAIILRTLRGNISIGRDEESRIASLIQPSRSAANNVEALTGSQSFANQLNGQKAGFSSELNSVKDKSGTFAGSSISPEDVIKLEARVVNLNVKVMDTMGRPLPNLKKEEFLLFEDGEQQDINYFDPVTSPLNIVLLLDLSGSTDSKMKIMKNAAKKFVDALNKEDRIAVAGFTRRFFIISNFTSDHELVKERIGKMKNRHSGTAYYDAMWATLDLLDEVKQARKAIVVLTDGVDNSLDHPDDEDYEPKHSFDELVERVQEADASIYPIYLDTEYEVLGRHGRSGHDAYVTARKQLEALAEQTGTEMFKANRAEDLESVYRQVAAELHSLYSIGYSPKVLRKDGKWRKISISVNREGARARTKRGYIAK